MKRRKRMRRKKKDDLKNLREKIKRGAFRDSKLIRSSDDMEKMSEVIRDFVEPYIKYADTDNSYRNLISLAAFAWNASFVSGKEQKKMIEEAIDEIIPRGTIKDKKIMRNLVKQLLIRKKVHFSKINRIIVDFEVVDRGDHYYVSVASTVNEKSLSEQEH